MATVSARAPTVNGAKYLQQLCKHWSHKFEVDLEDRRGVVHFPTAVVTMEADVDTLLVTIMADQHEAAERMKDVVATHLDRFAFREAPLSFEWSTSPA